jgi:hypothetical protein
MIYLTKLRLKSKKLSHKKNFSKKKEKNTTKTELS